MASMNASHRNATIFAAAIGLTLALGACHTTEGAGDDVESLGDTVEETTDDVVE